MYLLLPPSLVCTGTSSTWFFWANMADRHHIKSLRFERVFTMSNVTDTTPLPTPVDPAAPTTPATTPTDAATTPTTPTTPVTTPTTPVTTPPTTTPVAPETTPSTTTSIPPTSSEIPPTSTSETPPVTTPSTTTTPAPPGSTSVHIVTITPTQDGTTFISVVTSTSFPSNEAQSSTSSTSSSSSPTSGLAGQNDSISKGGLSDSGKIAIEVVVPIIAVALLVLGGIFFWRRRRHQKDAEEVRRKEVEEYGYNPNEDPSLPPVGAGGHSSDGPFQMREDGSGGYRGWGATTIAASSGRKASTTLSGGQSNPSNAPAGMAHSEGTSPSHGDSRSGEPLVSGRPVSNGSEVLGAMGPAAAENRGGNIHRGPSNASSSYSVANRSDGSGDQPVPGGAYGAAQYYSGDANYGGPYSDGSYANATGGRAEMGGQPVIRDNLARRATRIENPSHFPTQASAGISQNF